MKRKLLIFISIFFFILGLFGFYDLLFLHSEFTLLILFILPGCIILLNQIVFYKSSRKNSLRNFGGYCSACGDWCEIITEKSEECCECRGDIDPQDMCETCYEKTREIMT